jgi:hypothetical protein
MLSNFFSK